MSRRAPEEGVWDAGLQPERTGLAWRRTAVAFLALALAAPRVTWVLLDAWSLVPTSILLVGALLLLVLSRRRYDRVRRVLHDERPRQLPDGRLPAVATALALFCSLTAAALVATLAGWAH